MALSTIDNVAIRGLAACVPAQVEHNELFSHIEPKELSFLIKTIGVERKRKVSGSTVCSDLCFESAKTLLSELGWPPAEVELLIYVSQARDYLLPCTAIVLQDRLGMPKSAMAFDVPLGCSGYVYGLSIISSIMSAAKIKKGLLLAGDTSTFTVSPFDKKTFPLFGDAGSATALEFNPAAPAIHFNAGSDGSGFDTIIVPGGGCKEPLFDDENEMIKYRKGFQKGRSHLCMDGLKVFDFSIHTVPQNVRELLDFHHLTPDQIDYFLMHQANLIMNETIRKKLKFPGHKVPYSLKEFGNTSSASIPLTMVANLRDHLSVNSNHLLLSGFGVGLSWASALLHTNHLTIPKLIEYE
ncbi:MAG TPA: ketoacyl-ACP synthase III [Chitinophagaceae bacterium]|nr:ketoacyl-ACP synthase III [Chitinophagaceae bacterium]